MAAALRLQGFQCMNITMTQQTFWLFALTLIDVLATANKMQIMTMSVAPDKGLFQTEAVFVLRSVELHEC